MAYLVSHIAICLALALWLGLLLGWLLWGYAARQRGREVQTLRERLADTHFMSARAAAAPEPRLALQDAPDVLSSPLPITFSGSEMPEQPPMRRAFFEDTPEEPAPRPILSSPAAGTSASSPAPISADLEAEVREAKIQHLQQQVRELEGLRDRLPLLQADLSDAIAGRRNAEARFQEVKNDFEVRSSSLLLQIRDFEAAAAEWDRERAEFEREKLAHQKEVDAVKATLRDLQNSQRPQTADAPPPASAVELADLRDRYQKAVREREAAVAELALWKQADSGSHGASSRVAELEEALRSRDLQLSEQAARLESLLWRVAELEPFAAEAPQKEETLRRQESEIAGHMAMHDENAARLRSLQNLVEELHSTTIPADELKRVMAEHQAAMQGLLLDHQHRVSELEHALSMKEQEIAEHVSARYDQINLLNGLQARLAELEAEAERVQVLEQSLADRESEHQAATQALLSDQARQLDALRSDLESSHAAALETLTQRMQILEQSLAGRDIEIRSLLSVHGDTQRELEAARGELQTLRSEAERSRSEYAKQQERIAEMEAALSQQARELKQEKDLSRDKDGQLTFLNERLMSVSSRLAAHQQRLQELEPLAARTPEMEQKLRTLESQHHAELTRLKVNSAQRIRRFRQSINTFKT